MIKTLEARKSERSLKPKSLIEREYEYFQQLQGMKKDQKQSMVSLRDKKGNSIFNNESTGVKSVSNIYKKSN